MTTHEQWIAGVAQIATARAELTEAERGRFAAVKLAYGYGPGGALGITYHKRWKGQADDDAAPFVELCAGLERSIPELAGTVIHELGHAILGPGHGHGPEWRKMSMRLGLRKPRAVANAKVDGWARLEPDIRQAIVALGDPTDGTTTGEFVPVLVGPRGGKIKPCGGGLGTRGGKSRGPGSGSRLRKFVCECDPPVIVRASRDELQATCDLCNGAFNRAE